MTRAFPFLSTVGLLPAVLVLAACQSDGGDRSALAKLVPFTSPSPAEVARGAFDEDDADRRRRSVLLLAGASFGGEAPYVETYRLLLDDPDATVRGAAAKALGMHGGVADAARITPLLGDESAFVRWQAAQALQRIHNPVAIDPLMEVVKADPDADVRMAAAHALGQYPRSAVFDTLVGALIDTNYGVARAAARSLWLLTGQDLGSDPTAWLGWAEDRRPRLFAQQQAYTYRPYTPPPGLTDKLQFWNDASRIRHARPTGLDPQG